MSDIPTIWIDLENTPHVPFFLPIVRDLERAGCHVVITARDFAQTRELVMASGLDATIIGRAYGNATLPKVAGILWRAIQLAWHVRKYHPALAVGHGSRGLVLAAKLLRIPSLTLYDYEGASVRLFNRLSTWVMTPEVIPFETLAALGLPRAKHRTYPGLKEEVYASEFKPTLDFLIHEKEGGHNIDLSKIIVTLRPPSQSAHYRSNESFQLFDEIMRLLVARSDVEIVIVPRTQQQRTELAAKWRAANNVVILTEAISGLDLLTNSDLVIGGGGTVNREAAALGVPVVTIFKGPEGSVDRWLISEGRMIEAKHASDIVPLLKKRVAVGERGSTTRKGRSIIVETILRLAHQGASTKS